MFLFLADAGVSSGIEIVSQQKICTRRAKFTSDKSVCISEKEPGFISN